MDPTPYLEQLRPVLAEVIEPAAAATDQQARFPRANLAALAQAGLLGLVSAREVGGQGAGPGAAAAVVEHLAGACGSTAMVVAMHYCGAAVIERYGAPEPRRAIAAGRHLTTLAFSEAGSRSHFWAPVGSATAVDGAVVLDGTKSWITSAAEADSYVWSSKPLRAEGASTIWLVPAHAAGLSTVAPFDGLGMRGNASSPVKGAGVRVTEADRLGADGGGFDVMMGTVLPIFSLLNASASLGIAAAALRKAAAHVGQTKFQHLGQALAELPTIRAYLARARVALEAARTLRDDTVAALDANRADAMLRVLQVKACAAETALAVTDTAMRVCGGAAFRKDVGIERHFRDARAASVMAPTSDALYDFIGKAECGLPLF